MHTDQYFGAEATAFCVFVVVSVKGQLSLQLRKGLCAGEVALLLCADMSFHHRKFRYKGAPNLWEMRPWELFFYLGMITVVLIIAHFFLSV